jgi:hypothetical protein
MGREDFLDHCIGQVAAAGGRQAAVQRDLEGSGLGVSGVKDLSRQARRHGVAAGRSNPDAVDFLYRFHISPALSNIYPSCK